MAMSVTPRPLMNISLGGRACVSPTVCGGLGERLKCCHISRIGVGALKMQYKTAAFNNLVQQYRSSAPSQSPN